MEDFARLLVGEWIRFHPRWRTTGDAGRAWQRLTTPDEIAALGPRLGAATQAQAILRPVLLDEPGVHVLGPGRPTTTPPFAAGAIVNVTGEVAGLGNIFTRDATWSRAWGAGAAAARGSPAACHSWGGRPATSVEAAVAAGGERIGRLSVWLQLSPQPPLTDSSASATARRCSSAARAIEPALGQRDVARGTGAAALTLGGVARPRRRGSMVAISRSSASSESTRASEWRTVEPAGNPLRYQAMCLRMSRQALYSSP